MLGQWQAFGRILKGYPLEAFQLAARIPKFWIVSFAAAALIVGLFVATTVARSVAFANGIIGGMFSAMGGYGSSASYMSLGFGQWLGLVALGGIFAAVVFVLRALTLKWLFALRREPQPFSVGANILAVAYSGHVVVYFVTFILMFLPGVVINSIVLFVALTLVSLLNLAAELLIYIGINRVCRFEKSPLVPHTLLTAAWLVLAAIAYGVLFGMFAENLIG